MSQPFDMDIARAAARRAVDQIVDELKKLDELRRPYLELRDSPREAMLDAWMNAIVTEILHEQDRQNGTPPPHNPKGAPPPRLPPALAALLRAGSGGDGK